LLQDGDVVVGTFPRREKVMYSVFALAQLPCSTSAINQDGQKLKRFGSFEFDLPCGELRRDGVRILLQKK